MGRFLIRQGGGDGGEVGRAETLDLIVEEYEADQKRGDGERREETYGIQGFAFTISRWFASREREKRRNLWYPGICICYFSMVRLTWKGLVAESMRGCRVEGKQSCWSATILRIFEEERGRIVAYQ